MIRHSVAKDFSGIRVTKAVVYTDLPLSIVLRGDVQSSYVAVMGCEELGIYDSDASADEIEAKLQESDVLSVVKVMFPENNPVTKTEDVSGNEFYLKDIPFSVIKGIITPQSDRNGATVFNGKGTITIAEVIDAINAMENGANSNKSRRKSLDNISNVDDYFNEGYNMLCKTYASVFFNLYERGELFRPITRLEFAYILVVCLGIYGGITSKDFHMGVSFNWLKPNKYSSKFKDWQRYSISLITNKSPSFDVKDYKLGRSVSELLLDIQRGKSAIPLPMFMSMVELGLRGLFYYEDYTLNPLKQVTRGEAGYCLSRLCKSDIKY